MTKLRGRPFAVGNTAGKGRPKGSRNRLTLAAQELLGEHADAVMKKCVSMALKGDSTAMRLCLERLFPVRRATPVRFKLPAIKNPSDAVEAMNLLAGAVAKGKLTPQEGQQFLPILESLQHFMLIKDVDARVQAIEEKVERSSQT